MNRCAHKYTLIMATAMLVFIGVMHAIAAVSNRFPATEKSTVFLLSLGTVLLVCSLLTLRFRRSLVRLQIDYYISWRGSTSRWKPSLILNAIGVRSYESYAFYQNAIFVAIMFFTGAVLIVGELVPIFQGLH